jgi:tetratricopeptide (TPR) repeat protein
MKETESIKTCQRPPGRVAAENTNNHMKILVLISLLICTGAAKMSLAVEKLPGPLFDGLGDLHHPVTTKSKEAQRYFDQGLRLLFGFNHKEAIRSFRSAAQLDPECAMAYWGVAYAFGPHVNKPMDANDNAEAWAALRLAVGAKEKASAREQAYITALEKRYQEQHLEDRLPLDKGFAGAMRELAQRYPDDLDAQVLFAESLMNTMPWDYWTHDHSPKPETEEILSALRFVIARNPSHPGANHFYIHAVEAGPNPESGLAAADHLRNYAPSAGHLVHMPGHIYMRVGQYHDATLVNESAVKADLGYIQQCRALGFYPGVYYPHNMHFLWWSQLFEGRSKDALRTANDAATFAVDNYCGPKKALEAPRLRHLPWLTMARFGKWDDILAIAEPAKTNDFLVDQAVWHFVRGMAFNARKDVAAAERESEALGAIASSAEAKKLSSHAFPIADTLVVASHWLAGRTAGVKGNTTQMIEELEKAVAADEAMPYMEPAYWPLPARPALAAAWLRAGDATKAAKIFREDLIRWPRNPWSLFGLEQALRAQGDSESADLVKSQFDAAWVHADTELQLDWF